jgi:hypothetical protein
LPPVACARAGHARNAATKAHAPPAPMSARREQSNHRWCCIKCSSLFQLLHFAHRAAPQQPPAHHGCVTQQDLQITHALTRWLNDA